MSVYIKSINMGSGTLSINLGAEELFRPYNSDCPPPGQRPELPLITPDTTEPEPDPTPQIPSTGWYTEECDECCHPITDKIINYMEIVVVTFTSPGYTQNVTCEDVDIDTIVSNAVAAGDAIVNSFDPRQHTAGTLSKTRVKSKSDGTKVYDLDYNINVPIGDDKDHLEVVTYMKVDLDRMQSDFGFESARNLKAGTKSLMGAKATLEKIMEKGKTTEQSSYFVNSKTGKLWTGPVHYHPRKGFMGGAKHTTLPHPTLSRRQVPNVKVKNDNIKDKILSIDVGGSLTKNPFDEIDKLNSTSDKQKVSKSFISDLILSKGRDGTMRFLFYADPQKLVRLNSKFPGLVNSSIYRRSPIESFKIFRQRASAKSDLTELGLNKTGPATRDNQSIERSLVVSSSDKKGYNRQNSMNGGKIFDVYSKSLNQSRYKVDKDFDGIKEVNVGYITEISIGNINCDGFRVFSVEDFEISTFSAGKYRYMLELQFADPTIPYLNQKLSEICLAKDKLSELLTTVVNTKAYDSRNKRFGDNYRRSYRSYHNRTIKRALKQTASFLRIVTGFQDKEIINYLISAVSLQSGSPQGLETLIEVMGSFERKLFEALEGNISIDNAKNANIEKETSVSNKSKADSGRILIEKEFDSMVDLDNQSVLKFDYTGARAKSFPAMTDKQYDQRINEERTKFYSNKPSKSNGKSSSNLSKATLSALNRKTQESDYSYLTPAQITVGGTSMVLTGDNTQIDDVQLYKEINFRAAKGNKQSSKEAPPENANMNELAEDILAELGVSVKLEEQRTNVDKAYKNKIKGVEGHDSDDGPTLTNEFHFPEAHQADFVLDETVGKDKFKNAATETIANSVLGNALQKGVLDPDSPINQDQEVPDANEISNEKNKTGLSIESFDISKEKNILSQMDPSKVSSLPMGLRAVFQSRDKGRLNWLDHDRDLLKDPEIKDIFNYNQGSTVKVEYLTGHKNTNTGPSPNSKKYKSLTKKVIDEIPAGESILVKLTPVSLKDIGIEDESMNDKLIKSDIESEYFLINKPSKTEQKAALSPGPPPSNNNETDTDPPGMSPGSPPVGTDQPNSKYKYPSLPVLSITCTNVIPEIIEEEGIDIDTIIDTLPEEPSTVTQVCYAGV